MIANSRNQGSAHKRILSVAKHAAWDRFLVGGWLNIYQSRKNAFVYFSKDFLIFSVTIGRKDVF